MTGGAARDRRYLFRRAYELQGPQKDPPGLLGSDLTRVHEGYGERLEIISSSTK